MLAIDGMHALGVINNKIETVLADLASGNERLSKAAQDGTSSLCSLRSTC